MSKAKLIPHCNHCGVVMELDICKQNQGFCDKCAERVVVLARLDAGWTMDLFESSLSVDRDGYLIQRVAFYNNIRDVKQIKEEHITLLELQIVQAIEKRLLLWYTSQNSQETYLAIDDFEIHTLSFWVEKCLKHISVDGVGYWIKNQGAREIQEFVKIWNELHSYGIYFQRIRL